MRQIDSGYHDRFDYLSKKYTILLVALFFFSNTQESRFHYFKKKPLAIHVLHPVKNTLTYLMLVVFKV